MSGFEYQKNDNRMNDYYLQSNPDLVVIDPKTKCLSKVVGKVTIRQLKKKILTSTMVLGPLYWLKR